MIIFSDHALFQIKRRKISKISIKLATQNPDKIILSYRGRQLYRMSIGDKILEVVTKKEDTNMVIITAYYLEE